MKQLLITFFILNTSIGFAQHKYVIKVKGIEGKEVSGMPNLAGRNYANDSVAVVEGSLKLWDYYRTGNIVKVVSSLPSIPYFGFTINSDPSTIVSFKLSTYNSGSPFNVDIDWGDGTTSNFTGTLVYPTHTYLNGTYQVQFKFNSSDKITTLSFSAPPAYGNNGVTGIYNLDSVPDLNTLELFNNKITNWDPATVLPPELFTFSLRSNTIGPTFNPTVPLPSTLQLLNLRKTGISSFVPTLSLPAPLKEIYLDENNLSIAAVNATLVYLDGQTFSAGPKILYIQQLTPAAPSGAGAAAVTSLTGKGWTITHD